MKIVFWLCGMWSLIFIYPNTNIGMYEKNSFSWKVTDFYPQQEKYLNDT